MLILINLLLRLCLQFASNEKDHCHKYCFLSTFIISCLHRVLPVGLYCFLFALNTSCCSAFLLHPHFLFIEYSPCCTDVSVGFGNTSCIGSEALGVASFNIEVTGKYYIDFQVEVECRSGSALGTCVSSVFCLLFILSKRGCTRAKALWTVDPR